LRAVFEVKPTAEIGALALMEHLEAHILRHQAFERGGAKVLIHMMRNVREALTPSYLRKIRDLIDSGVEFSPPFPDHLKFGADA
jgi:hypothetical protein